MAAPERHTEGDVLERTKHETKKPELFKVLLLNDDYTTMDFVVEILETVFNKAPAEAYRSGPFASTFASCASGMRGQCRTLPVSRCTNGAPEVG